MPRNDNRQQPATAGQLSGTWPITQLMEVAMALARVEQQMRLPVNPDGSTILSTRDIVEVARQIPRMELPAGELIDVYMADVNLIMPGARHVIASDHVMTYDEWHAELSNPRLGVDATRRLLLIGQSAGHLSRGKRLETPVVTLDRLTQARLAADEQARKFLSEHARSSTTQADQPTPPATTEGATP